MPGGQKARPQICAALGKTTDGKKEVKKLAKRLDTLYLLVAKRLTGNQTISIRKEDDHECISLTPLVKVSEGQRLKQLKDAVGDLQPELDLPDLLLEVHRLTGFADVFVHISEKQACANISVPVDLCGIASGSL